MTFPRVNRLITDDPAAGLSPRVIVSSALSPSSHAGSRNVMRGRSCRSRFIPIQMSEVRGITRTLGSPAPVNSPVNVRPLFSVLAASCGR